MEWKWSGNELETEWKWNGNRMEVECNWNGNGNVMETEMEMEWKHMLT